MIDNLISRLTKFATELDREDLLTVIDRIIINEGDLMTEYAEQSALYAYVAVQFEMVKIDRKDVEAKVDREIRVNSKDEKKKPTEAAILAMIAVDDEVVNIRREEGLLQSLTKAFEHKKEMLITIGADRREEMRSTGMRLPQADREEVTKTKGRKAAKIAEK